MLTNYKILNEESFSELLQKKLAFENLVDALRDGKLDNAINQKVKKIISPEWLNKVNAEKRFKINLKHSFLINNEYTFNANDKYTVFNLKGTVKKGLIWDSTVIEPFSAGIWWPVYVHFKYKHHMINFISDFMLPLIVHNDTKYEYYSIAWYKNKLWEIKDYTPEKPITIIKNLDNNKIYRNPTSKDLAQLVY